VAYSAQLGKQVLLIADVLFDGDGNIIDCFDDSIFFRWPVGIVCIQSVALFPTSSISYYLLRSECAS
jgi:hypothetical protein